MKKKQSLTDHLWNLWCISSVIGIWPRYIEPNLLLLNRLTLKLPKLPKELAGLRIAHLSDLHWNKTFSRPLLYQLKQQLKRVEPHIIAFTGDFLSRSILEDREGLLELLSSISAPLGVFAVLGNHDYDRFVTANPNGDYDIDEKERDSVLKKGFKRMFSSVSLTGKTSSRAQEAAPHPELMKLLQDTQIELLHNRSKHLNFKSTGLNIIGLGEHSIGKCIPEQAFAQIDPSFPGITLVHNPDAFPTLLQYPSQLFLSGHTHGGQVNLPFLWRKFTLMEHPHLKSGLHSANGKQIHISRGIGSIMHFRWFAPPHITLITLQAG